MVAELKGLIADQKVWKAQQNHMEEEQLSLISEVGNVKASLKALASDVQKQYVSIQDNQNMTNNMLSKLYSMIGGDGTSTFTTCPKATTTVPVCEPTSTVTTPEGGKAVQSSFLVC